MPSTGDRPKWNTVKYESQIKVWFTARAPAILYLRESGNICLTEPGFFSHSACSSSVWNWSTWPELSLQSLFGLHGQSFLYSPHLVYMARAFFTVLIWSTWPEVSLQSSFGLHGLKFLYSPHLVYLARGFFTVFIGLLGQRVLYSLHWSTWPEVSLQSSLVYLARGFFTVLIGLLGQRVLYSLHWSTWPEGSLQSSLVYLARGFFTECSRDDEALLLRVQIVICVLFA